MPGQTRFILNAEDVTTGAAAGTLVLDYLRDRRRLVGTKEGCKEGDCGACVVLVGQLDGNRVEYRPVTSCLMPLAELHGKHLVTIEGISAGDLTPVQQAIIEHGGSQCGFCTPGIVMSLTGLLLNPRPGLNPDGVKYALGGNLCRCTGYASLKRAGQKLVQQFAPEDSPNGPADNKWLRHLIANKVVPPWFESIPARLSKIPGPVLRNGRVARDHFVAGGTDIYVQKGAELPDAHLHILNLNPGMRQIKLLQGRVHVGALTTFEDFAHAPLINEIIPEIQRYNLYNASWQIRNRATLGGNIINASPIGDMTALLLALECKLVLRAGRSKRTVEMTKFFKGYKTLDKKPGEILTEIIFPVPAEETKINFEKVSKRRTLDIASVNSAIKILATWDVVSSIDLTMGGVGPTPMYLHKTCEFLRGKRITRESIVEATRVAQSEISPISDIRGSAEYKRLLVRQLFIAHFARLFPKLISVREFYAAP